MEGLWKLTVEVNQESHQSSLVVDRAGNWTAWLPWVLGGLVLLGGGISLARGWRPPLWQIAVLALLAVAAWGLTRYAGKHRPADKSMGMEMDMAAADMGMTVTYTGTVEPYLEETVYPRVEGWLLELPVYPGDRVVRGQEVGRLDDRELSLRQARAVSANQVAAARIGEATAQVEVAQAGVAMARAKLEAVPKQAERLEAEIRKTAADLEYWRGVFEREEELFIAEAVSQEEYGEKKARYETARVAHHHAQVDLERVQAEVDAQAGVNVSAGLDQGVATRPLNSGSRPYDDGFSGGLSVAIPIFDGGERRARLNKEKAGKETRQLQLREAELEVTRQVTASRARWEAADSNVELAYREVKQAEEDLRIARLRSKVGRSIHLEILDALEATSRARLNLLAAQHDASVAHAELLLAMGVPGYPLEEAREGPPEPTRQD